MEERAAEESRGDETVEQALERVFIRLNADDRPNGRDERSLSMGDVVAIRELDANGIEYHAVACAGFETVGALVLTNVLGTDWKARRDAGEFDRR